MEDNKILVKKTELLFVAEFADLQRQYGWNALQYLFYFSATASPYYKSTKDYELRNTKVMESIRLNPWDANAKRLPKRLFEDVLFARASEKFIRDFDDDIELKEEAVFRESRNRRIDELKMLQEKETMTEEDIKKSESIIDYLGKLEKFHDTKKKAAKDRIAAEDGPAIIFADVME